jgi:hypothetical protein|tara:strand:+ start:53 stop:244 length:192 start_codon:yes stop_codon:yes gene_type:complete
MRDKIIQELKKSEFPNLKFLFSSESLTYATETLKFLLEEEKNEFEKFLNQPKESLKFESFDDE